MLKNNVSANHNHLAKMIEDRRKALRFNPTELYEWWRPSCTIRILLVVDGLLHFGMGGFGLAAFVSSLEEGSYKYGTFAITKAKRENRRPIGIIPNFRFSNQEHFTPDMYDQVWLFGSANNGIEMSEAEVTVLETFMDNGGGVFATGDHGNLGHTLCHKIKRVNKMRYWDNSSNEVAMTNSRRNDTNQLGSDLRSQFDDQSDDIPQYIFPKHYSSQRGLYIETYPHPLLCGSNGPITYLPDHPHEGECVVPTDLRDFPGGISPEIIATSLVSGGKTAGWSKDPTMPHSFGAICAYDGHKVNVGRVVTDASWHHFVNVNLIGEEGYSSQDIKSKGFMGSSDGQYYLSQIKEYYINIVLWIARKQNQKCINAGGLWKLLFQHRVLEASMDDSTQIFEKIPPKLLYSIGTHARDVLGKMAGQCRSRKSIFDGIQPSAPEFVDLVDPYIQEQESNSETPLPWFNYDAVTNIALAGGLLHMRDKFRNRDPKEYKKVSTDEIMEVYISGVQKGLSVAFNTIKRDMNNISKVLK